MLLSMKELLDRANRENYAIAAPNVVFELDTRACIAAAEKMNAPLILDISPAATNDLVLCSQYIAQIAEESYLPIALNLDHDGSKGGLKNKHLIVADIMNAIRGGFSSVMVDCSSYPYEDNVSAVAELTEMAHSIGLSVESELGHVGDAEVYEAQRESALTDPDLASDFVKRTKVDCLAVSIGNAHGTYKGTPFLDFDRLAKLKESTNGLPLVLHGGSGTGNENLHKACRNGINKVNYGMDLLVAAADAVKNTDMAGNNAYEFYRVIQFGYMDKLCEMIEVFGSAGKAWKPKKTYIPAAEKLFV